jgi:asparagine synthase (glutamine-hydrolysing)
MCGIAGKFNFTPAQPVDPRLLAAMTATLVHRGPDADGFYVDQSVGLGRRRLSIIDLATGSQPVANEDATMRVIFNGEICNFAELRSELTALGHRFRTHSDTEVIVHAYEQWGDHSVGRFRGMFAYAVWDEPRRQLLLVRDRIWRRPANGCAVRWQRWPPTCSSTAACATAVCSKPRQSPDSGASTAAAATTTVIVSGAW